MAVLGLTLLGSVGSGYRAADARMAEALRRVTSEILADCRIFQVYPHIHPHFEPRLAPQIPQSGCAGGRTQSKSEASY
jgi:hypothetical protein